jgi:hypothetical protein
VRSEGGFGQNSAAALLETKEFTPDLAGFWPNPRFQDRLRAAGKRRSETRKSLMPLAHVFDESL